MHMVRAVGIFYLSLRYTQEGKYSKRISTDNSDEKVDFVKFFDREKFARDHLFGISVIA